MCGCGCGSQCGSECVEREPGTALRTKHQERHAAPRTKHPHRTPHLARSGAGVPTLGHEAVVLSTGAAVCGDRGNDVAQPAKQATAADPQARSHDQPEEAAQKVAVVELAEPADHRAQHGRNTRVLLFSHPVLKYGGACGHVLSRGCHASPALWRPRPRSSAAPAVTASASSSRPATGLG